MLIAGQVGGASWFPGRPGCLQGRACAAFCLAHGRQGVSLVVKWGVLLVVGKTPCPATPPHTPAAGCRRGVRGATGQGLLLVAGKRCRGCCWAGGVVGRRQEVWGCHWAGVAAGRRQEV